jgi:hypothetical protein
MRNETSNPFIIGYEPEFKPVAKPSVHKGKKRR